MTLKIQQSQWACCFQTWLQSDLGLAWGAAKCGKHLTSISKRKYRVVRAWSISFDSANTQNSPAAGTFYRIYLCDYLQDHQAILVRAKHLSLDFFFSWWDPLQKHQLQPCWGGILYISHSWELQGHTTATYRKHRTIVRNTGFPTGMPEISYLWDFGNIQSKSACSSYLGLTSLWVRGCTGVKLHQPKDFHTLKILAFNQMHTEWCFDWPLDVQTSTTRQYQNSLRMVMSFSFFSLIVLLPL